MPTETITCHNCGVMLNADVFVFPDSKHWWNPDGSVNKDAAGENGGQIAGKRRCPVCGADLYSNDPF
jgi:hypothetical protein